MPKKNPKHQAQLQRQQVLTKRGKRIYNWKKIGLGLVLCGSVGVFIILGIIYGPQLFGRQVQEGDSVYIYYKLSLADGTVKQEGPAGGTKFEMTRGGLIDGFFENIIGMREGTSKSFTIPACPTHDCIDYKGYNDSNAPDPTLAWVELHFDVTIVRFA